MKLVFCGTPEFAVPTLRAVVDAGHEVALVLTQPDRPSGRKMEPHAPAVKQFALSRGLQVQQHERIRKNEALRAELEKIAPDAIVVVAYGRIIPQWMLDLPRFGNINLHGSLLPKYRGAAPIQWALANGERETGVTTMRLDAGLDTGEMLLARAVPVPHDATAEAMYPVLAEVGAELMLETLEGLAAGTLVAQKQDDTLASLAPILTRDDGRLDLQRHAQATFDRWRGFTPWPGCWCQFRGKRFLLHRISVAGPAADRRPTPGTLFVADSVLQLAVADDTALVLHEVQMEGKPRMSGADFARDYQVKQGESIG